MPAGDKKPIILKENRVPKSSGLTRLTLMQFFSGNIVELKFTRRIKPNPEKKKLKTGHMKDTRRMLCTSNWRFIASPMTRNLFKWKKPKSRRGKAWYEQRKLLIVWDLLMNNFRMVSLDDYQIIGYTPVNTLLTQAKFIAFYRQRLKNQPENRKKGFSDK